VNRSPTGAAVGPQHLRPQLDGRSIVGAPKQSGERPTKPGQRLQPLPAESVRENQSLEQVLIALRKASEKGVQLLSCSCFLVQWLSDVGLFQVKALPG
jgi:hypothetical protein